MKLKDFENLMQSLLLKMIKLPNFRFDKSLYAQLCREVNKNTTLNAPPVEPEVEFTHGPIDGVLGTHNSKTGRITIDVLEHFVLCVQGQPMSLEQLKQIFDQRLTETAAHEGGHWQLTKRFGFWPNLEKFAIRTLLIIIAALLGFVVLNTYNNWILHGLVPWSWAVNHVLGIISAIVSIVLYGWIVLKIFPWYLAFSLAMSCAVTYQICYHERYARKFAQRPKTDPRWDGVFEVD